MNHQNGDRGKIPGAGSFWIQIAWLMLLFLAMLLHLSDFSFGWPLLDDVRDRALGVPLGTIWFGALGGSLSFWYMWHATRPQEWDRRDDYAWGARPLVGAATGFIGSLLYLFFLEASSKGPVQIEPVTFAVVAFVFGFAHKAFLALVASVSQIVLKPAGSSDADPKTQGHG